MKKRSILTIIGLSFLLLGIKCGDKCYEVVNGELKEIPYPVPTPTPTISPSAPPTISPSPTPQCPSPPPAEQICSPNGGPHCDCYETEDDCNYKFIKCPDPEPTVTPIPPEDCSIYKPTTTGWSLLTGTLNNKQICGTPTNVKCGCDGEGCIFNAKVGSAYNGDSTPRYLGEAPCWKTGKVERCEYPPGSKCGDTTTWSAASGVTLIPESDGYGAKIKFPKSGTFEICAARKGIPNLKTCKKAKVS